MPRCGRLISAGGFFLNKNSSEPRPSVGASPTVNSGSTQSRAEQDQHQQLAGRRSRQSRSGRDRSPEPSELAMPERGQSYSSPFSAT